MLSTQGRDAAKAGAVIATSSNPDVVRRRDLYLKMYGNICYDTRDQYVNFPWSSEAQQ